MQEGTSILHDTILDKLGKAHLRQGFDAQARLRQGFVAQGGPVLRSILKST